jgi:hypothetical protein
MHRLVSVLVSDFHGDTNKRVLHHLSFTFLTLVVELSNKQKKPNSPFTGLLGFVLSGTIGNRLSNRQLSTSHFPHISLASGQRNQSLVAGVGDGDNSLSMRRDKSGSYGCMIQAAGAGGGWHVPATG